jgi:hypothetical protein
MEILVPLGLASMLAFVTRAILTRRGEEGVWLSRFFLIAFLLRIALATMFMLVPSTRVFHEDAAGSEYWAIYLARAWNHELPPADYLTGAENYGYPYFCGILCFVFGKFKGLPSFVNCWFGSLTGVALYALARRLFHPLVARRATLFVFFFPSNILWSAVAAKECVMVLLVVVTLYCIVLLRERASAPAIIGILLPMAAIYTLRFYIFFIILAALAGSFTLFSRRIGTSMGKQLVVFGLVAVMMAGLGLSRQAAANAQAITWERAVALRTGLATTANSGFYEDADISTPAKAIAFLPIGITFLLLSPFPWQLTSVRSAATMPEMIVWWAMFPAIFRGLLLALKHERERLAPIFVFTILLTCAYATIHGNVGVIFRQRTQITVFLYVFGALGYYAKRCKQLGLPNTILLARKS